MLTFQRNKYQVQSKTQNAESKTQNHESSPLTPARPQSGEGAGDTKLSTEERLQTDWICLSDI